MKQYIFGYLFVRLNRLAAIVCMIAGVASAWFLHSQATSQSEAASYTESDLLRLRLSKLMNLQNITKHRLLQLKGTSIYPAQFSAANEDIPLSSRFATMEQFAQLETSLNDVESSNSAMKAFVVAKFEQLVDDITKKLIKHAKDIADSEAPTAPHVQASPKSVNTDSVAKERENIFSDKLSRLNVDERVDTLTAAKNFLGTLRAASENPENKQILTDSMSEIDLFFLLLPALKSEAKRATEPSDQPIAPIREEVKAERVAAELNQVRIAVNSTVISNWAIDDAYEGAVEAYSAEREKCRQAEASVRRIRQDSIGAIVKVIAVSIVSAFVLLVLSDLTRAILDTAGNTGAVGDAYRAASESQDGAE